MARIRNRGNAACTFCRRRKIKCDKESPCSNCVKFHQECRLEIGGSSITNHKDNDGGANGHCNHGVYIDEINRLRDEVALLKDDTLVRLNYPVLKESWPSAGSSEVYSSESLQSLQSLQSLPSLETLESSNQPSEDGSTGDSSSPCTSPYLTSKLAPYVPCDHDSRSCKYQSLIGNFKYQSCSDSIGMVFPDTYFVMDLRKHFYHRFSWLHMLRFDTALSTTLNYLFYLKLVCSVDIFTLDDSSESVFEERYRDICWPHRAHIGFDDNRTIISLRPDIKDTLLANIEKVLPLDYLNIVDVFFKRYYIYWPFVDEKEFKTKLSSIIDPSNHKITITKEDTIDLGLLLVIITLVKQFEDSCNPELIKLAECCFYRFQFLSKSLLLLQLGVMLRIYYHTSIIDCDSYYMSIHDNFFPLLLSIALALGLNQDHKLEDIDDNVQTHLSRKIWAYLVWLDVSSHLLYGTSITLDARKITSKFPKFIPGVKNVDDELVERKAMDFFETIHPILIPLLDLINQTKSKDNINIASYVKYLAALEHNFIKGFRCSTSLQDVVYSICRDDVVHSHVFVYYHVISWLLTNYYYLANHYEQNNNPELSYFYFHKAMYIIHNNILVLTPQILKRDDFTTRFLQPVFTALVQRCVYINFALALRYKCKNLHYKPFIDSANHLIDTLDCLPTKTLFIWFVVRGSRFMLSMIESPEATDIVDSCLFTPEQLSHLSQIVTSSVFCFNQHQMSHENMSSSLLDEELERFWYQVEAHKQGKPKFDNNFKEFNSIEQYFYMI